MGNGAGWGLNFGILAAGADCGTLKCAVREVWGVMYGSRESLGWAVCGVIGMGSACDLLRLGVLGAPSLLIRSEACSNTSNGLGSCESAPGPVLRPEPRYGVLCSDRGVVSRPAFGRR